MQNADRKCKVSVSDLTLAVMQNVSSAMGKGELLPAATPSVKISD